MTPVERTDAPDARLRRILDEAAAKNGAMDASQMAGAIPLDASLLKGIVADALAARMKRPVTRVGVVARTIDVWCKDPKTRAAEVVSATHGAYEARVREIVGYLLAMGVDPERDGAFGIDFEAFGLGSVPNGAQGAGAPLVRFVLTWTPHDAATKDAENTKALVSA